MNYWESGIWNLPSEFAACRIWQDLFAGSSVFGFAIIERSMGMSNINNTQIHFTHENKTKDTMRVIYLLLLLGVLVPVSVEAAYPDALQWSTCADNGGHLCATLGKQKFNK